MRIPGHRERRFQPKVNIDSGEGEHGFQAT